MYLVIESTPGYMPDSEPAEFSEYKDGVSYANELADELEDQGYVCDRSWASSQNTYAIKCELPREMTVAPDLGRYIEVVEDETEPCPDCGGAGIRSEDEAKRVAARDGISIERARGYCGTCEASGTMPPFGES